MFGQAVSGDRFVITANGQTVFSESRTTLRVWWAETTWQMQRLRDNPECADQEHQAKSNDADPGLNVKLSFDINEDVAAPYIATGARPKVAVLREQGVNSHVEMAAAFHPCRLRCNRCAYERPAGSTRGPRRISRPGRVRRFLLR
ncbi:hypothetical protein ACNKHR_20570 [Shigella flexneri]